MWVLVTIDELSQGDGEQATAGGVAGGGYRGVAEGGCRTGRGVAEERAATDPAGIEVACCCGMAGGERRPGGRPVPRSAVVEAPALGAAPARPAAPTPESRAKERAVMPVCRRNNKKLLDQNSFRKEKQIHIPYTNG